MRKKKKINNYKSINSLNSYTKINYFMKSSRVCFKPWVLFPSITMSDSLNAEFYIHSHTRVFLTIA